jgi:hypothetical protein
VPEVTTEIVGSIIEIAAINAQTSSFLELIEYANKRILPVYDISYRCFSRIPSHTEYIRLLILTLTIFIKDSLLGSEV